jgi:hypothetical protein
MITAVWGWMPAPSRHRCTETCVVPDAALSGGVLHPFREALVRNTGLGHHGD